MNLEFPFQFDDRGRTAMTDDAEHVEDMIEQLIFTSPGERVNRPDYGSGLLQLIFGPNSLELAAALQFTIQGNLQRWLGDVVAIQDLSVRSEESLVQVHMLYTLRRTNETRTATMTRAV